MGPGYHRLALGEERYGGVVNAPLSPAAAAALVRARFGLDGVAEPLPSYVDENHRIVTGDAGEYILRLASPQEPIAVLAFQHRVLAHLADTGLPAPRVIRDRSGDALGRWQGRTVRLHTWIPGQPLARVDPTAGLWRDLGTHLGQLDAALQDLAAAAPERPFVWDLRQSLLLARDLEAVPDGPRRARIAGVLDRFRDRVLPVLAGLPATPVHNDANPHNVLVTVANGTPAISGLTDFGDAVRAPRVCEPAIAAAYALQPPWVLPPLETAAALFGGYRDTLPLTPTALALAPDLIEARVAVSVVQAAVTRARDPGNAYISIHEAPGWQLLDWLQAGGRAELAELFR